MRREQHVARQGGTQPLSALDGLAATAACVAACSALNPPA